MSRKAAVQTGTSGGVKTLTPGPADSSPVQSSSAASHGDSPQPPQAPTSAVAARLIGLAKPGHVHVHLASSERRADEIARALSGMSPDIEAFVLPPWDCLPYDRASPSKEVMGRRLDVIHRLGQTASGPRVVVLSPDALVQRFPPASVVAETRLLIKSGERLDRDGFVHFALDAGYSLEDRADEAGDLTLLGEVIDIFPADAPKPIRISLTDKDVIAELKSFDPLSQRTDQTIDAFTLGPASEWLAPVQGGGEARSPGIEHRLGEAFDQLDSLFSLAPRATFSQDAAARDGVARVQAQIVEAYEARLSLGAPGQDAPVRPQALYLIEGDIDAGLAAWTTLPLDLDGVEPAPRFAVAANPGRMVCDAIDQDRQAGRTVVLTGTRQERRALGKALERGLDLKPETTETWAAATAKPAGDVVMLDLDLDTGFRDASCSLTVIAASDVLGGRLAGKRTSMADVLQPDLDLHLGDVVLHEDHGVGILRGLVSVTIDGAPREALELEYHGEAKLLAPVEEIDRVWRYGGLDSAVALDRLKGDGWAKRRAEVSRQIDELATAMIRLAEVREQTQCDPIAPPKAAYARFAARFAYPETPDQSAAIKAVLEDLGSGKPMDRLICGDVGFGKTEVALRAAAAVALSGRQVAIAAPTTVLARQHFETFTRRFAGTGLKVAQLSRLVSSREADAVRTGLASGDIDIAVGTHALASEEVTFADLGLVIIDEEQKFGAALKDRLRALGQTAHLLTMTATPIPRTLQAAMVGIQDVSVIASPPARRRPIRTFLEPLDDATLRTALLRERRRGGQSFFVVPRIEDIEPMRQRLCGLVPEFSLRVAHGELDAEETDAVMVGFADGDGDVLLATNIIESGLDVPRANTMFIWRPDRFGLSQLHQLRGRVGRSRTQGIAYLLADPQEDFSPATRARLATLEAFDRLGAGLAISARDLDLRGGGDLVGEQQAGHVRLIGAALYHRLLDRAVRVAHGETLAAEWEPQLTLQDSGIIPETYIPDAATRINLYARLARMSDVAEIDAFEEEVADRFGPSPDPVLTVLMLARLRILAKAAGARKVVEGPKAIAITHPSALQADIPARLKRIAPGVTVSDDRFVVPLDGTAKTQPQALIEALLTALRA